MEIKLGDNLIAIGEKQFKIKAVFTNPFFQS